MLPLCPQIANVTPILPIRQIQQATQGLSSQQRIPIQQSKNPLPKALTITISTVENSPRRRPSRRLNQKTTTYPLLRIQSNNHDSHATHSPEPRNQKPEEPLPAVYPQFHPSTQPHAAQHNTNTQNPNPTAKHQILCFKPKKEKREMASPLFAILKSINQTLESGSPGDR
jgi:hypothetical protein